MEFPRHTVVTLRIATTLSTLNSHKPSARRNKWAEERKTQRAGSGHQYLPHGETLVCHEESEEGDTGSREAEAVRTDRSSHKSGEEERKEERRDQKGHADRGPHIL